MFRMEELSFNLLTHTKNSKAIINVVIGTLLIAIGPFFVEFSGLDAMGNCFYRLITGGLAFFAISLLKNEIFPYRHVGRLYILAACLITSDLLLYNQSILYIGSGLSTVLSNLEVVFLVLAGALFYQEKIDRSFLIVTLFILLGVFLLVQPYLSELHTNNILGISYALCASFVFSLYLLTLKLINKKFPEIPTTTSLGIICLLGAVILGFVMTITPHASFELPQSWMGIACVVLYSFVSQVCGWWFISQGVADLSLSTSGVLFLLQPLTTFLGDCLILGRNTEFLQIIGGLALLMSIYITVRNQEKCKGSP